MAYSANKYREAINKQYEALLNRRKRNLHPHANLLPDDLAEQIMKNGKKEVKELTKKIKDAEKELEKIKDLRKENFKKRHESLLVIPRSVTTTDFDGNEKIIELDPIYKSTKETAECDLKNSRLWKLKQRCERHISSLKSLRRNTIKVIDQAREGSFSAIFAIIKHWQNKPIYLGPISKIVEDKKIYTDAAGNPTPDGKPINEGISKKPPKKR